MHMKKKIDFSHREMQIRSTLLGYLLPIKLAKKKSNKCYIIFELMRLQGNRLTHTLLLGM